MKKLAVLFAVASLLIVTGAAFAETLPEGVTQTQIDSALHDLSDVYGSPVVRPDQAKAICNEEQYMVECAKIGQKYGLFPKARAEKVGALLDTLKGQAIETLKQCGDLDCIVGVATSLAKKLSASNPILAHDVDLTPEKVDEKRTIVDTAKSVGVDIQDCQSMDPDTAPIELLRGCAKLAKSENIQKYIPTENKAQGEKSDSMIALKEALAKGDVSCGDGTINGCGAFCLNPSADAKQAGITAIPSVCREIATKFFGDKGVQDLEQAYGKVQQTFDQVKTGSFVPNGNGTDKNGNPICPAFTESRCPVGQYHQSSRNELGCFVVSECIPINTKTEAPQVGKVMCPSMPTIDSCPAGQERVIAFSSPECGNYYVCRPMQSDNGTKFPYTFHSGRIVVSFDETRIYCYESGTGGATLRGDKTECESVFGIAVPTTPPEKQCAQFGAEWRSVDGSGNCFDQSMNHYFTPSGVLEQCVDKPVYGCSSSIVNNQPPNGQKQQVWNSNGLQSWVRTDADAARIESLKQVCANVSTGANIWMPSAGVASSGDFGMPDPAKCRLASACTAGQSFDGTSCTGTKDTTNTQESCRNAGGYWSTTGNFCQLPVPSVTTTTPGTGMGEVTGSCSSDMIALLGSGCHSMGNGWFNAAMSSYVLPGGVVLHSCSAEYVSGCTGGSPATNNSNAQTGCASAGGTWDSAQNYCKMPASACTSNQYWNGSTCVSSSASNTSGTGYNNQTAEHGCITSGGTWDATRSYCTMPNERYCPTGYWNGSACTYNSSGTQYSSPSCGSLVSQSSCNASPGCTWNSSSNTCTYSSSGAGACTSGQYWNGSACVTYSSSSTSCPSGQYWNGSACASTTSGSGSCTSSQYWNGSACVSSSSTSCPSGQYWNGSACVVNPSPSSSASCTSGQYWNGSACVSNTSSGSSACTSTQYWNGSSCVSNTSGTMDTASMQAGCTSAGGTWNSASNYCQMPNSSTGGCPSGQHWSGTACVTFSGSSQPLAFQCPSGHVWNGGYCMLSIRSPFEIYLSNVFSAFKSIFRF